jgi:hypothetical protein
MSHFTPALRRQVARARRRLFLQLLLHTLVRCWIVALFVAVGWFLAEPFVVGYDWPSLRWIVLGGTVAVASLLAAALALWRTPSPVVAALTLDERFQLKERVTTSLMLDPRDVESPAARALLADVDRRVAPLHVNDRFPLKLPWLAALVPTFAVVLVLLAFFYRPALNQAQGGDSEKKDDKAVAQSDDVQKTLEQMVKKGEVRKVADRQQSAEMQRIEKELEQMARRPHDSKAPVQDALKDLTSVEDHFRKHEKELADKQEAIKDELKQMDRLAKKDEKKDNKERPADRLDNALNKADFNRAQDEAERLSRKLQEQEQAKEELERLQKMKDEAKTPEEKERLQKEIEQAQKEQLSPEQKEELQQQLQEQKDKLERLTRDNEAKDEELREKEELGQIDKEQLERELEQLEKNGEKAQLTEEEKQQLKELAEKLGECKRCLKDGDDKKAGEKLAEAAKAMQKLDKKAEQKEVAQRLKEIQEAKQDLAQKMDGKNGKGNNKPDGGDRGKGERADNSGPNQGGQASGRRPDGKDDGKTAHQDTQSRSAQDAGRFDVVDEVAGQGFKGPRKADEMADDIRRASQSAPEAIDHQQMPRSAKDMTRGYFEKYRGPEKTPEK